MAYKQIATYDNYLLANMTLGLLQENGINCHLKDENIVTVDPLLNPAVGGIKLMVEETQFDSALSLIKQAESDYLLEIPCPYCQQPALAVEEKIDKPESFWGKMKYLVAYGQESSYEKYYRCNSCGKRIDELPLTF